VVGYARVNAPSGTALALDETVVVLGVVPDTVPLVGEDVPVAETRGKALAGATSAAEDGVYRTAVVRAFDPAAADADEEKELAALAPLAPEEAFDWM